MKFQYYIKNVYGNDTYYPIGEQFTRFVSCFGQKTITYPIWSALGIMEIETEEVLAPKDKNLPARYSKIERE